MLAWYAGAFLVALAVLVVVHEMGHYLAARYCTHALLLFGDYKGTVRETGFHWVNPFYTKRPISLRIRNFETGSSRTPEKKDAAGKVVEEQGRTHGRPSKVNVLHGNPVEISSVVVWRVVR